MPAPKDITLLKGAYTKDEIERKRQQKRQMTPDVKLKMPEYIKNSTVALAEWVRIIKLYKGTELLNALDTDLLTRYCIETAALKNLYKMRDRAQEDKKYEAFIELDARIDRKTALLNQMSLSLYLTPRSRAGAAPKRPEKINEDDGFSKGMFGE